MRQFTSGVYVHQGLYRAFEPSAIHRIWAVEDREILYLLSQADRELGRLDMFSTYVNNDLYIQLHFAKEATQSSRIEGTQTRMEEIFIHEDQINPRRRQDLQEVRNYIAAMQEGVHSLPELPFSTRLIRKLHKVLMAGVRGNGKSPGEFRTSQNWIGGATLKDAVFVPPPAERVPALMSDLEKFAHDDRDLFPVLLKTAVIHYQFETIHPFLDGNGRVGRLIIPLFLVSKGILKQPILYLSDFFERHRSLYFDNLMRVRTHHDMAQWLKFFLTGITETAREGIRTFDQILQLQKSMDTRFTCLGKRAADAHKVVQSLFANPVTDVGGVVAITGKSNVSAYKLIADLEKTGILREITGAQRHRVYLFSEYMDLFRPSH